jgi:phytochrome A
MLSHIRFLCLRFCRIKHKGLGVPREILSGTCKDDIKDMSGEALSVVSRYFLKLMNGDIRYVRKAGTSTFILTAKLASAPAAIGQ